MISEVKPAEFSRQGLIDYSESYLRHPEPGKNAKKYGKLAGSGSTGIGSSAPTNSQSNQKSSSSGSSKAAKVALDWQYDLLPDGPVDQTYSQYFAGNLSRKEAFDRLESMIKGPYGNGTDSWFDSSQSQAMITTEFKLAFYNQNDDLGIILTYEFALSNTGVLSYKKSSGLYKPQNYAQNWR